MDSIDHLCALTFAVQVLAGLGGVGRDSDPAGFASLPVSPASGRAAQYSADLYLVTVAHQSDMSDATQLQFR